MLEMSRWREVHWADKALLVGLFFLFLNANGSIAGVQLFPFPAVMLRAFVPVMFLLLVVVKQDLYFPIYWREIALFFVAATLVFLGSARSNIYVDRVDFELMNAYFFVIMGPILMYFSHRNLMVWFEKAIAWSFWLVGASAAVLGLIKVNIDSKGEIAPFVQYTDRYPLGASLVNDYNMYGLMVGIGSFAGFYLSKSFPKGQRWLLQVPSAIFTVVPVFTFSRRYFLFFIASIVVWVVVVIINFRRSGKRLTFLQKSFITGVSMTSISLITVFMLVILGEIKSLPGSGPAIEQLNVLIARFATIGELSSTIKDSRGNLLERGIQILEQRDAIEFFVGGNFDYIDLISVDNTSDYPHNPFVAAWLYGGILAFTTTLVILVSPLRYFLSRKCQFSFLQTAYFIQIFFLLISGNTYASTIYLGVFSFAGMVLLAKSKQDSPGLPGISHGYPIRAI
jgi:hypothetical protein